MFGVWTGSIAMGATLVVVLCALTALAVVFRMVLARRAAADARAGRVSAAAGHQRFLAAARRVNLVVVLAIGVGVAGPLMAQSLDPVVASFLAPATPSLAWAVALCVAGLALAVPLALDSILSAALTAPIVLGALRGFDISRRALLVAAGKQLVVTYLPLLVTIEAAGLFPLLGRMDLLWIPMAALGLLLVIRLVFSEPLRRWLIRTEPLERSRWAAFAPRVDAWARLAGVRLAGVRVQYTSNLGWTNLNLSGWRRRTLYLSDGVLTDADWRQRDTLVAQALGVAKAPRRWALARHGQTFASFITIGLVLAIVFGLDRISFGGPAADLLGGLGTLVLLGVLSGYVIFRQVRRRAGGPVAFQRRVLGNDRYAAELTGDPLALLVALNTLTALNAMSIEKRIGGFPSIAERVRALDALLYQPGPRAPWATRPVPSVVPVTLGAYPVTIPLGDAPPPGEVPAVPYGHGASAMPSAYVASAPGASS